jgi:GH24 family phage-related lysozyme (muramidase)
MQPFKEYYTEQTLMNEGFLKNLGTAAIAGTLALTPHSGKSQTPTPPVYSMNIVSTDPVVNYIEKHEGKRHKVYLDSKGLKHIGIGHRLVSSDIQLFQSLFRSEVSYPLISNGSQSLDDESIYKLFEQDLRKCRVVANHRYTKFNTFSDELKSALLDSIFRGEVHPRVDQLINASKFTEASKEYLNDKEYQEAKSKGSGVAARMEENAKNILHGSIKS